MNVQRIPPMVVGMVGVLLLLLIGCAIEPSHLSGASSAAPPASTGAPMSKRTARPTAGYTDGYIVTVFPKGGDGICSNGPVTAFSYQVVAPAPGLLAVLAANGPAFDALRDADLTNPSSASLPAPFLEMSCTAPGTTTCTKQFPTGRTFKPQVMCILLKSNHDQWIEAKIDVNWTYAP